MSETKSEDRRPATRPGARKVCLVVAAVALLGLGGAIGVVATKAAAHTGGSHWKGWHHRGPVASEADALERMKGVSARILGKVEASGAQREQVDAMLEALVAEAWPLREEHRENRRHLVAELTRPTVDREALEGLRARELALADHLSRELVEAVVALSGILDAEQRVALVERFTHDHH